MSPFGKLSVMIKAYKLLCKSFYPQLYNHCLYKSSNEIERTWLKELETQEKQYFLNKSYDYLNYIQKEIGRGKSIDELIQETEGTKIINTNPTRKEDIKEYGDCFITKNEEFINYIKSELKRGKELQEIVMETQKTLAEIRQSESLSKRM